MISPTSQNTLAFSEYVALLVKLHELEKAGQAESEDADAVRDAMDAPWRKLTSQEIELVRGLSSDLFSIDTKPNDVAIVPAKLDGAIRAAADRDEYVKLLSLLRENLTNLPSAYTAHWRGNCWADLRQFEAAIPFYQEARKHQPSNDFHAYFLSHAMLAAQRQQGAREFANSIASKENASPPLLWITAMIFFQRAAEAAPAVDTELLRAGIRSVERANKSATPNILTAFKSDAVAANTLRAVAYDQLDKTESALEACEFVLQLEPFDRTARYMRAILTRATNPTASKEDTAVSLRLPESSQTALYHESKFSSFESFQPVLTY